MMVHMCNPSTREAKAGWLQVQGHLRLHFENLSGIPPSQISLMYLLTSFRTFTISVLSTNPFQIYFTTLALWSSNRQLKDTEFLGSLIPFFFFSSVLVFELRAYTLSHSSNPFLWWVFLKIGSQEPFAQATFELRSSWSLPPEWLGL
jgi:hypothetical protein